jgi:hypothetical protein
MKLVASIAALVVVLVLGTGTTAKGSAAACIAAPVRTTASPPTSGGPRGVPWMRAGRTVGYLFGSALPLSPGRAALYTGGIGPGGGSMKVLWAVRDSRRTVTIAGDRLDGPGTFSESFPGASVSGARDYGYYPSIVDIPAAGCWRLTVLSPGKRGRFAVLAFDK